MKSERGHGGTGRWKMEVPPRRGRWQQPWRALRPPAQTAWSTWTAIGEPALGGTRTVAVSPRRSVPPWVHRSYSCPLGGPSQQSSCTLHSRCCHCRCGWVAAARVSRGGGRPRLAPPKVGRHVSAAVAALSDSLLAAAQCGIGCPPASQTVRGSAAGRERKGGSDSSDGGGSCGGDGRSGSGGSAGRVKDGGSGPRLRARYLRDIDTQLGATSVTAIAAHRRLQCVRLAHVASEMIGAGGAGLVTVNATTVVLARRLGGRRWGLWVPPPNHTLSFRTVATLQD